MQQRITKASEQAVELIAHYESFQSRAYLCPAGVWTIGWGTTRHFDGSKIRAGQRVSLAQGKALLAKDLLSCELDVDRLCVDTINQHQFDALVSLVHNIGGPQFSTSTVRRLVNAGEKDPLKMQIAFRAWNKITKRIAGVSVKVVSNGLVNRRQSEELLFNTGRLAFFYAGRETK